VIAVECVERSNSGLGRSVPCSYLRLGSSSRVMT
jgi:hypothetical protein